MNLKQITLSYCPSNLYVDSNGNKPGNQASLSNLGQAKERITKETRKLARMVEGSNNYKKQEAKLAKARTKVINMKKDFIHKESTRLVNDYNGKVYIETLTNSENYKSSQNDEWGIDDFLNFTNVVNHKAIKLDK